jgi:small subunit ribosomal protein S1
MLSLGVDGAARLQAGDTVKVMVLQPSSAEGHAIVSLDRARGEEGWDILAARHESGEVFDGQITGHNRGGVLVNVEGVNAFVPLSQIDSVRRDDPDAANALANLAGTTVRLKVLELNRKRNRVILSERAAMAEWRKEQKERIIDELQEGEIRDGVDLGTRQEAPRPLPHRRHGPGLHPQGRPRNHENLPVAQAGSARAMGRHG